MNEENAWKAVLLLTGRRITQGVNFQAFDPDWNTVLIAVSNYLENNSREAISQEGLKVHFSRRSQHCTPKSSNFPKEPIATEKAAGTATGRSVQMNVPKGSGFVPRNT